MLLLSELLPYLIISFILMFCGLMVYDSYSLNKIGLFYSLITVYLIKVSIKLSFLTISDDDYRNKLIVQIVQSIREIKISDSILSLNELFNRLVQILEVKKGFYPKDNQLYEDCIRFSHVLKMNIMQTLVGHSLGLDFRIRLGSIIRTMESVLIKD